MSDPSSVPRASEGRRQIDFDRSALRFILDSLPTQVSYIDADLRYRFVNEAYRAISKVPPEKIIGMKVQELLGDDFFNRIQPHLKKVLSGEPAEYEETQHNPVGEIRDIIVKYVPDRNAKNEVIGFIVWVHDVTEIRTKERILLSQNERMISSARLAALGEMAAGISHEINNPLTIIQHSVDRLADEASKETPSVSVLKAVAEKIGATVSRITKITRALRSVAIDSEGEPFSVVKLFPILNETIEMSRAKFSNRGIELITNCPENLEFECRPTQISQVILNLLNNAYDAVDGQDVMKVEVHCLPYADEVEIKIADTGHGVPVHLKDRIFEPFMTTKGVDKGTGLGLSVSRGIIKSHHGSITLKLENGLTSFIIRLPKHQNA